MHTVHRRRSAIAVLALILTALLASGLPPTYAAPRPPNQPTPESNSLSSINAVGAIISNGTIQLGVNPEGHLNVDGGTPSAGGNSTTVVGIRYVPSNGDGVSPGCLCEGWGAADTTTNTTGYVSIHEDQGPNNMTLQSFTNTATEATSIVTIGGKMRVTHHYHPTALTSSLYQVDVTVQNISAASINLRYRRVMDWDIQPNTFNEYVTIQGTSGNPTVLFASDNGFASANPLAGPSDLDYTGDFIDAGPGDYGALFDFGFGAVSAGQSKQFTFYYGAAGTETNAVQALGTVGASVYSLGQPDTGQTTGAPNTFMFGLSGTVSTFFPDHITADKPQSKVWYNDGLWWAVMLHVPSGTFHIYKLDRPSSLWIDTGTVVETRRETHADALWNGTYLFVVSGGGEQSFGDELDGEFYRFTYSTSTKTYTKDVGPITMRTGGGESLAIDQDTTGRLWLTYTKDNRVYVRRSGVQGATWPDAAFILPNSGTLHEDDISSVVAFQSNIGVMWSNHNSDGIYFAYHQDSAAPGTWMPIETIYQGTCYADDHINMKVDASGQIFAAVKTSLSDAHPASNSLASCNGNNGSPMLYLLVRKLNGTWLKAPFSTADRQGDDDLGHTRPSIVIDQTNSTVYMFATKPTGGGGIFMKKTSTLDPAFGGDGTQVITPFLPNVEQYEVNDPTTTKQRVDATSDLLLLASDSTAYRHTILDITSGQQPPSTRIKDITFENAQIVHATTGVDQVNNGETTISLETTAPLKGTYSVRVQNPSNNAAYLQESFPATNDLYVSCYLKIHSLPPQDVRIILISNDGTSVGSLVLRPTGVLRFRNGITSTTIGDSAPLQVGQVYHVGIHQKSGNGDAILEAFVADSNDMLVTPFARSATETITTPADRLRFGSTTSHGLNMTFDDFRIKNARGYDF